MLREKKKLTIKLNKKCSPISLLRRRILEQIISFYLFPEQIAFEKLLSNHVRCLETKAEQPEHTNLWLSPRWPPITPCIRLKKNRLRVRVSYWTQKKLYDMIIQSAMPRIDRTFSRSYRCRIGQNKNDTITSM